MSGITLNNLTFHMTRAYTPDRTQLLRSMLESLSLEELEQLCSRLHIEYRELPGVTKGEKIRGLLAHCDCQNLGSQLAQASAMFFL